MVRQCLASLLALLVVAPLVALADCSCPILRDVIGEYTTMEVTRYRGGLTSTEEAEQRIGERTKVSGNTFSLWGEVEYDEPYYEVACRSGRQEEGEVAVPSERWGSFYGFGDDRDVIVILYVLPAENEGARLSLEIVGDELWFFHDGWFYRMKREA